MLARRERPLLEGVRHGRIGPVIAFGGVAIIISGASVVWLSDDSTSPLATIAVWVLGIAASTLYLVPSVRVDADGVEIRRSLLRVDRIASADIAHIGVAQRTARGRSIPALRLADGKTVMLDPLGTPPLGDAQETIELARDIGKILGREGPAPGGT